MAAAMSSEDGCLCFRLENRNASKEREPKGTSVNEGDLQRAFDGLTEYIKEDYKEEIRLGRTRPELDPIGLKQEGPLIKPTKGSLFHVELTKSANNNEFKKYLKTIEDWKSEAQCSVWMSSTLPADLSFSTDKKPPDCVIVQAFVIGSDLFPYVLTLYDEKKGTKEAASKYTVDTARLLSRSLYQQYHGSFYLLPVTLPDAADNEFNHDSLAREIKVQIEFAKNYIKKLEKLKQDEYEKLRETTAVLSSMSHVPGEEEKANKFLLYDIKWREALHLAIEKLHTAEGNTELLYTPKNEKKVETLLLEAVRRLGRMYRLNIFTKRTDVQACVRKLQQRADTEGGCKLLIEMDVELDSARDVISVKVLKDKSADNTAKEETAKSKPQNKKKSTIDTQTARETQAFLKGETGARGWPPPAAVKSQGEQSGLRFGKSECTYCQGLLETIGSITVISMTGILEQFSGTTKQTRTKGQKNEEFLAKMNALMNSGGGTLLIHMEDPHSAAQFDDQVGQKLMNLIADDTTYSDNFERFFLDQIHLIFRVKARQRPFLSTLHFNTKLSTDRGLCDPTHSQMRRFLSFSDDPEPPVVIPTVVIPTDRFWKFEKDRELTEIDGRVFFKSLHIQAKSVKGFLEHKCQSTNRDTRVSEYIWSDLRLPLHISALSKVREGGSVYFGVKEIKDETDPKTGKRYTISTGKYLCEGTVLDDTQRQNLRRAIQEKVQKEMLWVGLSEPDHPVDIKFHPVKNGEPDLVVVEVFVRFFHGVAFYDREGPEAYTFASDGRIHRINLKQWLENHKSVFVRQEPVFT